MKKLFLLSLLVLHVLCLSQNWSWNVGNGGNPSRNCQAENVLSPLTENNVLWEGSEVFSYWPHQPFTEENIVVTDRTFNMSNTLHGTWIVAYDILTGDTLWTVDLPVDFPSSDWRNRVCGTNDGVVYATRSGNTNASYLHALDINDGSIIWTSTTLVDMSSSECVTFAENGDLIVGNFHSICRINAQDGSLIWEETRNSPTSGGSEVAVFGNNIYGWAAGGPRIVVHDIDTGAFLYESEGIGGGFVQQLGCLVGPDGIVYAPRTQNNAISDSLVAFTDTGSSLERMWQISLGYVPFATFGVDLDGNIYSYTPDYRIIHIDSHSGETLSQTSSIAQEIPVIRSSFMGGSLSIPRGENTIRISYAHQNSRELTILDTSIVIGNSASGTVSPQAAVDAEGYLYVSNYQNTVYCFESNLDIIWQDTFDRPDGPAISMDGHLIICADNYEMKVYEGRGNAVVNGSVFGNVTLTGGTGNVEEVQITTGGYSTNPDTSGLYTIELPPGIYDITADLEGYQSQTVENVTVDSGQATGEINFDLNALSGNDQNLELIDIVLSNYPNPFNPETSINFFISENSGNIELTVYNLKGQKIKQLINDQLPVGQHSVIWNGTDENGKNVSSGVYLYKMETGNYSETKKMILMK
ncbi:MAG: PQQ-binding-like beta-propeller repeat protein [Candidatus Cloacimonetes bacterium]|nr:PQQ-binding-like beta-propeller repeat protein [Candidatus Cloacimonadota bacterium]